LETISRAFLSSVPQRIVVYALLCAQADRVLTGGAWNPMLWPTWGFRYVRLYRGAESNTCGFANNIEAASAVGGMTNFSVCG